ncbi:hypothetical protein BC567DRAFT_280335 [Phyllosticta citribraziliensis]
MSESRAPSPPPMPKGKQTRLLNVAQSPDALSQKRKRSFDSLPPSPTSPGYLEDSGQLDEWERDVPWIERDKSSPPVPDYLDSTEDFGIYPDDIENSAELVEYERDSTWWSAFFAAVESSKEESLDDSIDGFLRDKFDQSPNGASLDDHELLEELLSENSSGLDYDEAMIDRTIELILGPSSCHAPNGSIYEATEFLQNCRDHG